MSTLTLPGTIPGLLRRGSPVLLPTPIGKRIQFRKLVESQEIGGAGVHLACGMFERAVDVHLDLTDATGRAHAAWWLAERRRLPYPTRAAWYAPPAEEGSDGLDGSWPTVIQLDRGWWCGNEFWSADGSMFSGLDPDDPSLLPDGSRWVDAEALRRVVLHVAGVAL